MSFSGLHKILIENSALNHLYHQLQWYTASCDFVTMRHFLLPTFFTSVVGKSKSNEINQLFHINIFDAPGCLKYKDGNGFYTFAKLGLAAYFAKFNLARLMKGPSGVDNIDACELKKKKLQSSFLSESV